MATYVRGIDKTGLPVLGLVQSINFDNSCEFATAEDEAGNVAAEAAFGKKESGSMEVVYDTTATLPDAGSVISIRTKNYTVDSVSKKESNKDFIRASINFHRYIDNTIPPAA